MAQTKTPEHRHSHSFVSLWLLETSMLQKIVNYKQVSPVIVYRYADQPNKVSPTQRFLSGIYQVEKAIMAAERIIYSIYIYIIKGC